MPNRLALESSPYLLQHANNPVNWFPWGSEALEKAKSENKLILISVGYSACHWCHVMEHESFEDEQVAQLMNNLFVCIKVDREERPDIDQVYMNAIQLMSGQGGWPLNCFCLPDARPIFGGTYFRKKEWMEILVNLSQTYSQNLSEALEYADKLERGMKMSELISVKSDKKVIHKSFFEDILSTWKSQFDTINGGFGTAPKFPMPNTFDYFLNHLFYFPNSELENFVQLTLQNWTTTGIYDILGAGFYRYSVDEKWFAPHFEKMLYDNGQLIQLFAKGYKYFKNPAFLKIAEDSIDFCLKEWDNGEGGFYSAYDADSEGQEGKFYCWKFEELETLCKEDFFWFKDLYHLSKLGNWEHEWNILHEFIPRKEIAIKFNFSVDELNEKLKKIHKELFLYREKRIKPGLDNKVICAWNALLLKGICETYSASLNEKYLTLAIKNADYLLDNFFDGEKVFRLFSKNGKKIFGFLDDYSLLIDALLSIYQISFKEKYLLKAKEILEIVLQDFKDENSDLFFYTSKKSEKLIIRKQDFMDNVISSGNSIMANVMIKLSNYFAKSEWSEQANQMFFNIESKIQKYPSAYANWLNVGLCIHSPLKELVYTGPNAIKELKIKMQRFQSDSLLSLAKENSTVPSLLFKFSKENDVVYECELGNCKLVKKN